MGCTDHGRTGHIPLQVNFPETDLGTMEITWDIDGYYLCKIQFSSQEQAGCPTTIEVRLR